MSARVFVLDNYDSFTFNLVGALRALGAEVEVRRNDCVQLPEIARWEPSHVLISPGPGRPEEAGLSLRLVDACLQEGWPLLGVCLGHQALGQALGGAVVRGRPVHGKSSLVQHADGGLMRGLPRPVQVARYHSLVLCPRRLPAALEVVGWTDAEEIMAVRHRDLPVHGVQFHPESFLCPDGPRLLASFLAERWPQGQLVSACSAMP